MAEPQGVSLEEAVAQNRQALQGMSVVLMQMEARVGELEAVVRELISVLYQEPQEPQEPVIEASLVEE